MRLMQLDPEPMDKIRVKYIAYWCGKPIDADNLIKGMKPALDALTEYGLIEDDNPEYVKGIEVEYHRVKHRKHVGLQVTVLYLLVFAKIVAMKRFTQMIMTLRK